MAADSTAAEDLRAVSEGGHLAAADLDLDSMVRPEVARREEV